MGWLVDEFVVGWVVAADWKIVPSHHGYFFTVEVTPMIHCKRTSEREVETPTSRTTQLSRSCICEWKLWHSHFPSVVRSLLCVSRTDILESCWCSVIALRIATAVLAKESCRVHTTSQRCAPHALRRVAVTEDILGASVVRTLFNALSGLLE